MARIEWLLPEGYWDGADGDYTMTLKKDGTRAVYHFDDGGEIVLRGKNLQLTGGELTGGTVSKITFLNNDDIPFMVAEGRFKGATLGQVAIDSSGYGLRNALYGRDDLIFGSQGRDTIEGGNGDDEIRGRNGDDYLAGGVGNDTLTGGKGADYFAISDDAGVFHDVVTDFRPTGAGHDTLYTSLNIVKVQRQHRGEDTLLTADDGSTILLEHVTKKQWLDYDMPL